MEILYTTVKKACLSKYLNICHFIIIKISIRCILLVVILHQTIPYVRTQSCIQDPTVQCDTEKVINLSHVKKHLYPLVSEDQRKFLPDAPFTAPVKRIHSRHRRFVAPGASWGLKVCKICKITFAIHTVFFQCVLFHVSKLKHLITFD